MVKVIYTYEVSKERQDEYLKVTKDTIKSFWESHGCDAYTIWSPNGEPTKFVKEMLFKDEQTMENSMKQAEAEPIKRLFSQYATSVTRATYRQIL
jgi:quinol monooxygenase YgiN